MLNRKGRLTGAPKDLTQLAAERGLTLQPIRMPREIVFFVKRGDQLLFDGESFDQDELREWLCGDEVKK